MAFCTSIALEKKLRLRGTGLKSTATEEMMTAAGPHKDRLQVWWVPSTACSTEGKGRFAFWRYVKDGEVTTDYRCPASPEP